MPDLRVIVRSSDALARAGLSAILGAHPGYLVIGENGTDPEVHADVIVWEAGAEPRARPEELAELTEAGVPVVALVPDETSAGAALAAGARGILPRDVDADSLAACLGAVSQGLLVLHPELAAALPIRERPTALAEDLTPREREVLQLLAEGLPNKSIADRLQITEHTAKYHVAAILAKVGAQTRTEAVARAARLGLILF
jgi:DNA-binding NarL/FixJ family response regulator